jgi:putative ABC transport system permease protein
MRMTLYNHTAQALLNLTASKLRSLLAMLGILVGTAAVVALINCSQLATEKALAQFKALGTDLLSVSVFQQSANRSSSGQDHVSIAFWRELPTRIPTILRIAPYSSAYQPMSFQGHTLQGSIIGADEALADILHLHLSEGAFVSSLESFEQVCVIGAGLAHQLKEQTLNSPIGQQLRLGKGIYSIIGILSPWDENGFFNEDINQAAIIPLQGMSLVNTDAKINNAVLLLKPDSPIDPLIDNIKQTISEHAPKLSIYVRSAKQIINSMESQGKIFTLLLAVIGSISLVVGGIGIMNVMLVSVSERKKEIGIRKAVGAKNKDIQTLFLVESVILSLSGGILGVILGLVLTLCIAYFNHWPYTLYLIPPLAGFIVSVTTGIFFGYYPARRAARLEPMESLRSE